jgi:hypothetical protein
MGKLRIVSMEGILTMSELQQNETLAETNQVTSLPEPHFDDLAIAVAQPVEPLSTPKRPRWQKLAMLSRHISATALLFILLGMAGFATVAFGLAGLHRWNDQPEAVVAPANEPEPGPVTEESKKSITVNQEINSRRSKVKKTPIRVDDDERPVARKVGEIVN